LKIFLHYDKFKVQMKINGPAKIVALLSILLAGSLLLAGCEIQPVSGRYTYIVKYEVSSTTVLLPDVTRDNDIGKDQGLIGVTLPWTEEFTLTYESNGYDNQFTPKLTVTATIPAGESITYSISWKDYKTDFQEQVLESETEAGLQTITDTLFASPLPLP